MAIKQNECINYIYSIFVCLFLTVEKDMRKLEARLKKMFLMLFVFVLLIPSTDDIYGRVLSGATCLQNSGFS